ncbi:MAG: cobyrinate a,c-diamide synthase, partial [Eubacterium sp.]
AYLSKVLGIPVFLIINGRGMSKSAAAMVKGYVDFDPEVRVAGVIVNRLSSESHYHLLKEMIETHAGVPCVGWMPECPELAVNSRHLGLIPVDELADIQKKVDQAAALAEAHIDLDQMLSLSETICPQGLMADPFQSRAGQYKGLRIGIPRDQAFNFYYQDNLSALEVLGVELVFFSPLAHGALPDNLDGLYIGGGFPEVFGKEFEDNGVFRENARQALEAGLPCFAECGGLMVLTQWLADKTADPTEGIGFLPARTVMTERLQRFGYVEVLAEIRGESICTRAHEFHHSLVEAEEALPTAYTVSKGNRQWRCGYVKKNTIAGYPHIHFYSNPQFLIALLDGAMEVKHAKGRG